MVFTCTETRNQSCYAMPRRITQLIPYVSRPGYGGSHADGGSESILAAAGVGQACAIRCDLRQARDSIGLPDYNRESGVIRVRWLLRQGQR